MYTSENSFPLELGMRIMSEKEIIDSQIIKIQVDGESGHNEILEHDVHDCLAQSRKEDEDMIEKELLSEPFPEKVILTETGYQVVLDDGTDYSYLTLNW